MEQTKIRLLFTQPKKKMIPSQSGLKDKNLSTKKHESAFQEISESDDDRRQGKSEACGGGMGPRIECGGSSEVSAVCEGCITGDEDGEPVHVKA
jgi:hypothetical protein